MLPSPSNHNVDNGDNDVDHNEEATEQEIMWAQAIKKAAQADPDINADLILDVEYLQHAIVILGTTTDAQFDNIAKKALKRIRRLQEFKNSYGIKLDGSLEEGLRDLQTFQKAHPGFCPPEW